MWFNVNNVSVNSYGHVDSFVVLLNVPVNSYGHVETVS